MIHPFPGVILDFGGTLFLVFHHRLKTKFYGLIKIVPDGIKKKQSESFIQISHLEKKFALHLF
jgi:hypothetical protein